jgi:hypothetical protein
MAATSSSALVDPSDPSDPAASAALAVSRPSAVPADPVLAASKAGAPEVSAAEPESEESEQESEPGLDDSGLGGSDRSGSELPDSAESGSRSPSGGQLKAELPSDDHDLARAVTAAHHAGPQGISPTVESMEENEGCRPCGLTTSLYLPSSRIENLSE